jgi:hypothetical protein
MWMIQVYLYFRLSALLAGNRTARKLQNFSQKVKKFSTFRLFEFFVFFDFSSRNLLECELIDFSNFSNFSNFSTFRLFEFFELFDFSNFSNFSTFRLFEFFEFFDFSSRNLLECELFNFSGETFLPRLEFSAKSCVWTTQTIHQTGYARVPVLSSILHQKASEVQVLWVGKMPSQKPTKIVADDILRYYILLCYIIYFFNII